METLSFVGNKFELRRYLDRHTPNCKECNDEGFITKTEWVGEDTSYEVEVSCACNED